MVLQAPITRATHAALREAVLELKDLESRRTFPVTLRVGVPGGQSFAFEEPADEPLDHALRCEVAAALLHRCRRGSGAPFAWLTRPGDLAPHPADHAWCAAVRAARAEAGAAGEFVVVTRAGWRDPVSGVRREWRRLRRRPARS